MGIVYVELWYVCDPVDKMSHHSDNFPILVSDYTSFDRFVGAKRRNNLNPCVFWSSLVTIVALVVYVAAHIVERVTSRVWTLGCRL